MNQLIEVLQHMQKRPQMYFGGGEEARSIHLLEAFVLGFQTARGAEQTPNETGGLDLFREWVGVHYRTLVDGQNGFILILEHVGNPRLAFDEFFRLLPLYVSDRKQWGREGILRRFTEIQDELWEQFGKDPKND
jgi:hypothetical protein